MTKSVLMITLCTRVHCHVDRNKLSSYYKELVSYKFEYKVTAIMETMKLAFSMSLAFYS